MRLPFILFGTVLICGIVSIDVDTPYDLALSEAEQGLRLGSDAKSVQSRSCLPRHHIKLDNATIIVARIPKDPLNWVQKLAGIPHVLETEFPKRCKHPDLRPHEALKPRAYKGFTSFECGGFLNYIIDQYDRLPKTAIFVHGEPLGAERDKHGDPRIFSIIRNIAGDPSKVGYCSLNKQSTWYGYGVKDLHALEKSFAHLDPARFGNVLAALRPIFHEHEQLECYGNSQFAVSGDRIRNHPLAMYMELLDWIRDAATKEEEEDDRCYFLEAAWHRLFGENAACNRNDRCAIVYGQNGTVAGKTRRRRRRTRTATRSRS